MEASPVQALYEQVGAFVDELVRGGVSQFVVCPGSRSTPLALTIARHPGAKLWMHVDERSAAFFGLGLAKFRREPVALVCTSGTAAANFLPAVVEAFISRIPLVVLTADRPHELRDNGAPQTIDQVRLYGTHVRWFLDLAEPAPLPQMEAYVRTAACRAVAAARGEPAGPVHVNCPYREPLVLPSGELAPPSTGRLDGQPYVAVAKGRLDPDPAWIAGLARDLASIPNGLIVAGPQDDPSLAEPIARLAGTLGYPILADPLSHLRGGPHDRTAVVDGYDAFLRDESFAARLVPEVVLRFGAIPTSKPLQLFVQRHRTARQIVVDGGGGWNEPTGLATDMAHVDARRLCEALVAELPPSPARESARARWREAWTQANGRTRAALAGKMEALDEMFEGKAFAELAEWLPDGATLFVGNSMPVRDLDSFFFGSERRVRVLANRGANGIDGVVSSALGASAGGAGPLLLVLGDLSFYHDSNGLLAARQHGLDATIVVLNNDGGGIFSFLPQASQPEHFETLFGTPHGLDFRPVAEMYGARFERVTTWDDFRVSVRRGIDEGGLHVIEVPTRRDDNVGLHRGMWQAVAEALMQDLAEVGS